MTSGSKPELHLNPWCFGRVLHTAEPHVRELTSLARIEYLSSDRITICYIHKTCRFACSFTSCSPISDQINVGWVAVKLSQKLGILNSDSTKIDRFANWRTGGKRACNTAYFTSISYSDMIRTQILNQRLSSELAKLWNQWKKPRVRCGSDCWCGKTRWNGYTAVPTWTRKGTADLGPFLTLVIHHLRGFELMIKPLRMRTSHQQRMLTISQYTIQWSNHDLNLILVISCLCCRT